MSHLSHSQAQEHEERRPFAAQSSSPSSSPRHPRSPSSSPSYQAVDKSRPNTTTTTTTTSDPAAYESDSDSETDIDSSSSSSSPSRGQTTPLVQGTPSEETLAVSEATGSHRNHHHHRPHRSPLRRRVIMLLATLSQIGLFIFFGALAGAVVKAPWVYPYSWHPICMGLYGFVATEGKNGLLKPKSLAMFTSEAVD